MSVIGLQIDSMQKPTFDRKRPLSWSAISSFEYDPEQWYRKYALGQEDGATKEMLFGSEIGRRLASDPTFMPQVPRGEVFEYELRFMFGDIPMVGYIDSWSEKTQFILDEYKTGKKAWTKKRADEHGQFDTYTLGMWVLRKIRPEDIKLRLHWLPTQENGDFSISFIDPKDCKTFQTSRSMSDILRFGMRINEIYKKMDEYCKNHI